MCRSLRIDTGFENWLASSKAGGNYSTMIRNLLVLVMFCMAVFAPRALQANPFLTQVTIPDLQKDRQLLAWQAIPEVSGPVPAVVMLHGCSGAGFSGTVLSIYKAWAAILTEAGYATLLIDSAGSRNFRATCGPGPERSVMYRERPADAYAGLRYLQSLAAIDPARISLIGWSQGGGIVLLTMNSQSIGRPTPPPEHDFRAAVAFYPAKCAAHLHVQPYTTVEPGHWESIAPILILQGGADNWTPAAPCQAFVHELRNKGEPISITIYPEALHSFDAPDLTPRARAGAKTADGSQPRIGTDKAARQAAIAAVLDFLDKQL